MSAKILLVDDEPNALRVLEYALLLEGYGVVTAGNGEEALTGLHTGCPDVVILDAMMPDVSGAELCRILRMRPDTCDIPIIMLSARARLPDEVSGLEAGANDYITKPVDLSTVIAHIEALLPPPEGEDGSYRDSCPPGRLENANLQETSLLHGDRSA